MQPDAIQEAERAVLGTLLISEAELDATAEIVRPEHFVNPTHRQLFTTFLALRDANSRIDLLTVRTEWGEGFPSEYIAGLVDGLPRGLKTDSGARLIRENARRRAIEALSVKIPAWLSETDSTDAVIDRLMQALSRIHEAGDDRSYVVPITDAIKEAVARLDKFCASDTGVTGVPTGLPGLDRITGGLQPGSLYTIGARPRRGKSALAKQVAVFAATAGFRVLFFTLEMLPSHVAQRMLLSDAQVDKWDLKQRPDFGWPKLAKSHEKLAKLPIEFDRHESPTLAHIRTHVKRMKRENGCDLVIVDYFQRCHLGKSDNRYEGLTEIAIGLKSLAQHFEVPVLLPAQLRREAEEKRPTLADIKECGALEHESDVVAFLHPTSVPGLDPDRAMELEFPAVDLIVEKNREGESRVIRLSFERRWVRFVEAEEGRPL